MVQVRVHNEPHSLLGRGNAISFLTDRAKQAVMVVDHIDISPIRAELRAEHGLLILFQLVQAGTLGQACDQDLCQMSSITRRKFPPSIPFRADERRS